MSEPARYLNGVPANLPAAAWDALAWLERMPRPADAENRTRLESCTAALREQLAPHLPAPDPAPVETPGLATTGEAAEESGA